MTSHISTSQKLLLSINLSRDICWVFISPENSYERNLGLLSLISKDDVWDSILRKCFFKTSFPLANFCFPVKMANKLSKIILWMSQKCVWSARQFRKISIKAWIYSTCKSQLQLSHIYPHQPPQLGGFLLNRYGNPVPAGFSGKKKGIQVGSKLEDLVISVVICSTPLKNMRKSNWIINPKNQQKSG